MIDRAARSRSLSKNGWVEKLVLVTGRASWHLLAREIWSIGDDNTPIYSAISLRGEESRQREREREREKKERKKEAHYSTNSYGIWYIPYIRGICVFQTDGSSNTDVVGPRRITGYTISLSELTSARACIAPLIFSPGHRFPSIHRFTAPAFPYFARLTDRARRFSFQIIFFPSLTLFEPDNFNVSPRSATFHLYAL